eukprot:scaffold988_cov165-Ochromonas_danica.AAC.4
MAASPREGLLKNVLGGNAQQQRKDENLRRLQERVELAAMHGHGHGGLPPQAGVLRADYFADMQFLLDSFARLGMELRSFPVGQRNYHLRQALGQMNQLLYFRMLSGQPFASLHTYHYPQHSPPSARRHGRAPPTQSLPWSNSGGGYGDRAAYEEEEFYNHAPHHISPPPLHAEALPSEYHHFYQNQRYGRHHQGMDGPLREGSGRSYSSGRESEMMLGSAGQGISVHTVASLCPAIASYSLHLPLLHSHNPIYRILRFLEEECEILPSKDKAPYLVVVELLEEAGDHTVKSPALYLHGRRGIFFDKETLLTAGDVSETLEEAELKDNGLLPTGADESDSAGNVHVQMFAREDTASRKDTVQAANVNGGDGSAYRETVSSGQPVTKIVRPDLRGGSSNGGGFYANNNNNAAWYPPPSSSQPYPSYNGDGYYNWNGPQQPPPPPPLGGDPYYDPYGPPPAYDPYAAPPAYDPARYAPPSNGPSGSVINDQGLGYVRSKTWAEKKRLLQSLSPFGHLPGYTIKSFIVKSGDDLNKEILALQLLSYMKEVFKAEGLDIYLRSYQILSTGYQSGLIEYLEGSVSIDKIKKIYVDKSFNLKSYFNLHFGESYNMVHQKAVLNFVRSLVGYSLFTYVIQVKDRHNANILVDSEGHIIHIDFGFILGDSPGFNLNFESAPFKLTAEYLDLLGGLDSPNFRLFEDLFVRGFLALQKHLDGLCAIVQLFYGDKRKNAAESLRARLLFPRSHTDILSLIGDSLDNWRTRQYDWFQQQSNNIQM